MSPDSLPIIHARRILRDDSGPSGELGPTEEFVEVQGNLYPLAQLTSVPPVPPGLLAISDDVARVWQVCFRCGRSIPGGPWVNFSGPYCAECFMIVTHI